MRGLLATILFAAALVVPTGFAQTSTAPAPPAKPALPTVQAPIGNYKALDFWAKLKLGSAYYTNPEAVSAVRVAYSFDPKTFAATGKSEELWMLAKDGKVTFGIPDSPTSSMQAVPIGKLSIDYKVETSADLARLLASTDISVVANEASLLGTSAAQTFVRVTGK